VFRLQHAPPRGESPAALRRHGGWTRRNKMGVVPRHEIAEPASIAIRRA
jgi:hypothetical protein